MCEIFYILFHQLQLILTLNSLLIQNLGFFLAYTHSMCEIVFENSFQEDWLQLSISNI